LVFWGNHRDIAYSFHNFSVFCVSIVLILLHYVFCVWALKFFITLFFDLKNFLFPGFLFDSSLFLIPSRHLLSFYSTCLTAFFISLI
jgi:hypothetical protein